MYHNGEKMTSETIQLQGHIIDSLTLSKVLDLVLHLGGEYEILSFDVGKTPHLPSTASIRVSAHSSSELEHILHEIGMHGARRADRRSSWAAAERDGVLPEGFYATTNLATEVFVDGVWQSVTPIEMDCAVVLRDGAAHCVPMHRVKQGEMVLVGDGGVRVAPMASARKDELFGFMGSDVSTERPKEQIISAIAQQMMKCREAGRRVLLVGGPAIVHTGAGRHLAAMIRAGWIDVLFAGNALAAHDIEQALLGTSLGVDLQTGQVYATGHEHHLRAINTIRRCGSIAAAVSSGVLKSGIMHACIERGVPYVLAGSIRDDGPLPDVITDTMQAQDAMRAQIPDVGICLMVATTLHSIATGNMLPAEVLTVCVDSDPDTVTKLLDRGSHQAFGLVTDGEFFLKTLASMLPGAEIRG